MQLYNTYQQGQAAVTKLRDLLGTTPSVAESPDAILLPPIDGAIDLAMVIRSIVVDGAGSTVGTGGGITALSDPGEELAEARLKAAALLRVLGVR